MVIQMSPLICQMKWLACCRPGYSECIRAVISSMSCLELFTYFHVIDKQIFFFCVWYLESSLVVEACSF